MEEHQLLTSLMAWPVPDIQVSQIIWSSREKWLRVISNEVSNQQDGAFFFNTLPIIYQMHNLWTTWGICSKRKKLTAPINGFLQAIVRTMTIFFYIPNRTIRSTCFRLHIMCARIMPPRKKEKIHILIIIH